MPRPATRLLLVLLVVSLAVAACGTRGDRFAAKRAASSTTTTSAGTSSPSPPSTAGPTSTTAAASSAAPCSPARPAPSGVTEHSIDVAGEQRSYLVDVPTSYDGSAAVPLVMTFHGFSSNDRQQLAYSRFGTVGEREGFVTVAPQGRGSPAGWDFFTPATQPRSDGAFVKALLAQLQTDLCLDVDRLYANGISNGSAVTFALACGGDFGFAAYGGVAGAFYVPQCDDAPPAPIIYFHGTADPLVPIDGGQSLRTTVKGAQGTMSDWAGHNGCAGGPTTTTPAPTISLLSWSGCQGDADVDYYVIDGGGHTWPGSTGLPVGFLGATTDAIDATELMWAFFVAHPHG